MKKSILLSLLTATILATISFAGGNIAPVEPISTQQEVVPIYVGAGLSVGRYNASNYEDVTYGSMVRIGYDLNQYVGFEARYVATFWDEGRINGQELEHIGIFFKPMIPFNENFNIYGLLGYGWIQTTTSGLLNKAIDDNGLSAGIGLEYDLSDKRDDYDENIYYPEGFDGQADQEMGWGLFIDYQRLLVDSDLPDLDVVSVGVTYDF